MYQGVNTMTDYALLCKQLMALADENHAIIPVLSNASALLNEALSDINWVGFYIMNNGSLLLGPFQGKVACISIPIGKGVCGTAVQKNTIQLVDDVHAFAGHIACDSASNSEIVLPIHHNESIFGVLDIDSPSFGRFTLEDKKGLQQFVTTLEQVLDFNSAH